MAWCNWDAFGLKVIRDFCPLRVWCLITFKKVVRPWVRPQSFLVIGLFSSLLSSAYTALWSVLLLRTVQSEYPRRF